MYNNPPCKYGTEIKWGGFAGYCTIFMDDVSGIWYEHHDNDNLWYAIPAPKTPSETPDILPPETPDIPPSKTPAIPPSELPPYIPPPPAPVVEQPECVPIAGKPADCGGMGGYDRYDCINGKITFIESNSTRCGYQVPITTQDQLISGNEPVVNQPVQSGSNTTMILIAIGIAAMVGIYVISKKKGGI